MKIVCGSCQAKYSIADEKVAGKVFKIRCKRCSEVIVVRGDQEGNVPPVNSNGHAEHDEADAPVDAIWHVVINGEQAGPYSPAQLGELIHAGQLDWEAYVWCEGFENWQPMRDVAQLVAAISGASAGAGNEEAAAHSQPMQLAAQPSMGADPFAEEVAPVQMYAKAAGGQGGGGGGHAVVSRSAMTSSSSSSSSSGSVSFDPSPKVPVSAPSPRVTSEQALTGARNENSVLFSLKNLQALATGSSSPAPAASQRPGYAGGEGSGLIDIRALATTTGVAEPNRSSTEKDALLSLGSAQAGAFGALGSPMLAPAGKADDEDGKKGLMFAIVGGFGLLAVAGIAIALIMKPAGTSQTVIGPVAPAPTTVSPAPSGAAVPPSARPEPTAPSEPKSEGEIAAEAKAAALAAAAKNTEPSDDKRGHNTNNKHVAATEKNEPEKPVAAARTEPEKPPEKGPRKAAANASIDDLLAGALPSKGGAAGKKDAAAAATANLAEKPTRDDVLSAMKGVTDAVKACGKGQTGVAFANVTVIGKTGRVSNVEVTGMAGDVGSCIARSVRKASFPKFQAENFQVKFPFRL
ncbi:MAG: hypothetical protein RL701_7515 [Pseudomonadota bacterium]|jgi:predicted Zn finger-like uncharacterized protein